VIVKHNATYLSAYAHNQQLLVKDDQAVRRGQKIAEMGRATADRVQLHFEIRRQGKPIDPRGCCRALTGCKFYSSSSAVPRRAASTA
jgi:septal ring factor EnvC (AmiA/AmiB activator)